MPFLGTKKPRRSRAKIRNRTEGKLLVGGRGAPRIVVVSGAPYRGLIAVFEVPISQCMGQGDARAILPIPGAPFDHARANLLALHACARPLATFRAPKFRLRTAPRIGFPSEFGTATDTEKIGVDWGRGFCCLFFLGGSHLGSSKLARRVDSSLA